MSEVLIMAGGKSSRMRNSTKRSTHKALEKVYDTTLLEINILYAYYYNFKNISISISSSEPELIRYTDFLNSAYKQTDLNLSLIIEELPLGTIGAVQLMETSPNALLVLNVDNLLALDLKQFIKAHENSKAAMSIATHLEPFKIPFGELVIEDGKVIDYLEKPIKKFNVSSGTYILSQEVQMFLKNHYKGRSLSIPELFLAISAQDKEVYSFYHSAFWTDINDNETLLNIQQQAKWPLMAELLALKDKLSNTNLRYYEK